MLYGQNFAPDIFLGENKTRKKIAKYRNFKTFTDSMALLSDKALKRYDIEHCPPTINKRVVLQSLLWYAAATFFEKEGHVMALPSGATEDFNVYGDPKKAYVWGRNGFTDIIRVYMKGGDDLRAIRQGTSGIITPQEYQGVYVRENMLQYPFINYVVLYAEKIASVMRTLDVVESNLKNPYIVTAEESVIPSVKRFFEDRDTNLDYIVSSGIFPADKIKVTDLGNNNGANLSSCTDLIEWYMNQFDELCGLHSNANVDKKAQISVPELNSRDDSAASILSGTVDYLNEQLDTVNKVFGLNLRAVCNTMNTREETNENEDIQRDSAE